MDAKSLGQLWKDRPEILDDSQRFSAILRDLYPKERSKVNLIITVFDTGIVSMLRDDLSDCFLGSRLVSLLMEDYSIAEERAQWAVDLWLDAYYFFQHGVLKAPSRPDETDPMFFRFQNTETGCVITKYIGPDTDKIVLPAQINGVPITAIEGSLPPQNKFPDHTYSVFSDCDSLTSISFPDSVIKIGPNTFLSCTKLTDISFPEHIEEIGERAFMYCTGLASVSLPESVTEIGAHAFNGCAGLTSISFPKSVRKIGMYAFSNCTGLTRVSIPEGIEKIPAYAFFHCTRLTSITIPEGVKSIGGCAFQYCTSLTRVSIPGSVEDIGSGVFDNTPWLKSLGTFAVVNGILLAYQGSEKFVTLPDGIREIGSMAFSSRKNLISVTIPSSVTKISYSAFYRCLSLTSVTIPESVTEIYGQPFEDTPWQKNLGEFPVVNGILFDYQGPGGNVAIPEGVQKIGGRTFSHSRSLTSIIIPKSVKEIGRSAFSGCSNLTNVMIAEGVVKIDEYAFAHCTNLANVTIPKSVTEIDSNAFYNCPNLMICAPAGSEALRYAMRAMIPFQIIR